MKIIVTGATGLIGAEVVRQAIADNEIEEIILLVRSKPEQDHPKMTVVLHNDFLDYSQATAHFQRADALLWCLGISQTQVSREQYIVITYDYAMACASFCQQQNPSIRFLFISGDGADRSEKNRVLFKRIKGKTENGLRSSGLKELIIARPDAVRPKHKNKKAPFVYKLGYPLFPIIEKLAPHKIIWSDVLARALLKITKNGHPTDTIENIELRTMGK